MIRLLINIFPPQATALLTGLAAWAIYLLSAEDFILLKDGFVLLTTLLLVYLLIEVSRVRHVHPVRWLINPVVLCSLMTFVLGFGITNILYFLPEDSLFLIGVLPIVTTSMNKLMLLVVFGALSMWLGYWSPLAKKLTIRGALVRFRNQYLRPDARLKVWVLPVLLFVSLISRLAQMKLGVFGYASNYERLIEAASYTQYLSMGASLGKLALVIAAFQYFTPRSGYRAKTWFFGLFFLEIIFGLLSGFKSAVVNPFIIVVFCQYIQSGRLSRYWLIAIPLALIVAYAVIEPYRVMINNDVGNSGMSFATMSNVLNESRSLAADNVAEKGEAVLLLNLINRFNATYVGSLGVAFIDKAGDLPLGSPDFFGDIVFAPVYALIPRFLWEGKPIGNIGLWYTHTILGRSHNSSTAMGPFTYLYFAGGIIAVFMGFFFIGILQRVLFFITQSWVSSAGGILYMSMLVTVVVVDSAFNGIIVSLFRELPLVLLLLFFFYNRSQGAGFNEKK